VQVSLLHSTAYGAFHAANIKVDRLYKDFVKVLGFKVQASTVAPAAGSRVDAPPMRS
jgi:hypothetical protein